MYGLKAVPFRDEPTVPPGAAWKNSVPKLREGRYGLYRLREKAILEKRQKINRVRLL
jgi:hypothetical protein